MSLGIATGCYGIAVSVFATTTSLFLADAVHVGPVLIGVYFTGCAAAGIGVNLAAGWFSDRLADRRAALAITGLAGVAGAVTFIAVRDYAVIFVTGAVFFSLNGVYFSQLFAYAKEFAEGMGRKVAPFSSAVRSVFSAAWVMGPPAGFYLLAHLGFGPMYGGAAGLLLATALLGRWGLPSLLRPVAGDTMNSHRPGMRAVLATVPRRTWLLLGSVTALNVADQMYLIVIALYVTRDLRLSPALVGLMAGACAALEIPLMIAAGHLADRVGKLRLVVAAVVIAAVFFCLLPVAGSTSALLALQLPNAAWTAVIMSIPMVIAQQEVPGGSGTASALYTSTFMLAQLLAGAITGEVAAQAGYRNVFWICACLCALATAFLLCRIASRPYRAVRSRFNRGPQSLHEREGASTDDSREHRHTGTVGHGQ
jgi:SET family sugar efflux transporter-like MFS transporter